MGRWKRSPGRPLLQKPTPEHRRGRHRAPRRRPGPCNTRPHQDHLSAEARPETQDIAQLRRLPVPGPVRPVRLLGPRRLPNGERTGSDMRRQTRDLLVLIAECSVTPRDAVEAASVDGLALNDHTAANSRGHQMRPKRYQGLPGTGPWSGADCKAFRILSNGRCENRIPPVCGRNSSCTPLPRSRPTIPPSKDTSKVNRSSGPAGPRICWNISLGNDSGPLSH